VSGDVPQKLTRTPFATSRATPASGGRGPGLKSRSGLPRRQRNQSESGGWWLALAHLITGVPLCLTIIGIPLGVADFKMAGAALAPFGKQIVGKNELQQAQPPAISV
jgi:Inner membrane component domain